MAESFGRGNVLLKSVPLKRLRAYAYHRDWGSVQTCPARLLGELLRDSSRARRAVDGRPPDVSSSPTRNEQALS